MTILICWVKKMFVQLKLWSGLPKIYKNFNKLVKTLIFIIETNGTAHYLTATFLVSLFKPLTINQFTFDDSFDAARKINNISRKLSNCGYKMWYLMWGHSLPMYLYIKLLMVSWKEHMRINSSRLTLRKDLWKFFAWYIYKNIDVYF